MKHLRSFVYVSLLLSVAAVSGCGDDGRTDRCLVSEYTGHCDGGLYWMCRAGKDGVRGRLEGVASVKLSGDDLTGECVSDGAFSIASACIDGVFEENGRNLGRLDGRTYVCNADGSISEVEICGRGFVPGCVGGAYRTCEDGIVASSGIASINGFEFVCGASGALVPASPCVGGVFTSSGTEYVYTTDSLFRCVRDSIEDVTAVTVSSCDAGGRLYYDSREVNYYVQDCGVGRGCERYEKNGLIFSKCFDASDVTEGCAEGVSVRGSCDKGGGLVMCSNPDPRLGRTLRIDCPAQGRACILVEEDYGYDCAILCGGDDGYDDFGRCDGNHLSYCTQSGVFAETECPSGCGFTGVYYDCL